MTTSRNLTSAGKVLSDDLHTLNVYFHQWRLRLNVAKTVCSTFHLANRLAKNCLQVKLDDNYIAFEPKPKYLGITLDRSLTYGPHIKATAAKVQSRCNLLRRLAGNRWGSSFHVLRTSTLSLCYSVAEYCAPVWSRSSHTHLIDASLHCAMRLIAGAIRSTPVQYLPILSGILPPDLRRKESCLKLATRAINDPTHLLHHLMTGKSRSQNGRRLHSRHPISVDLHIQSANINGDYTSTHQMWDARWQQEICRLSQFLPAPSLQPLGCDLPRREWVLLNRLRSGHGRYGAFLLKIGASQNDRCSCGESQTPAHVDICGEIAMQGNMATVDPDFRAWLSRTNLRL